MTKPHPPWPIQVVLFDLDGTLADTAPDLAAALNHTLVSHGKEALPYETIRPYVSHGGDVMVKAAFGLQPDDENFVSIKQDFLRYYLDNICIETKLFSGMAEVLDALEKRSIRWGVVTNKPAYLTDPLVHQLSLSGRAACVVSGDTTQYSKPHPEPIYHACQLARSRPADALYVGDAARDIEAGKRADCYTLTALFGYIGTEDRPQEWGADGSISTPAALLDYIS